MGLPRIIYVPGKNPKPAAELHRAALWRCLLEGVRRVDPAAGRQLAERPEVFHLAAWSERYYGVVRAFGDEADIEVLCAKAGADARDRAEALSWRRRWARIMYMVADHFSFLIGLLPDPAVRSAVAETERYFRNREGVGQAVREFVKAPLRAAFAVGEPVLLIGHSMGSIIAYDALWELCCEEPADGRLDLLLTVGSPLGMHYVQRRLRGYFAHTGLRHPRNVRRWVNIAAQGDLTALDPEVRGHFDAMVRTGVTEEISDLHADVFTWFRDRHGLNVHRSYGYLIEPHVAATVADWWQRHAGAATRPPKVVL